MIPIELTLKGIYSYQKKCRIDFNKLLEGQLFGIFGSVGSGKSTILEAISFVLYGKFERLNIRGDSRYYNMMNLKSNELLIDYTFKVGRDEDKYRFIAEGKRNKNRFDDVNVDRRAFKYENENWIPVEVDEIEKIIGLDYDNFKRTIIIPQGKFEEFLNLTDSDRTTMMKTIFNLHKYDLFPEVKYIASRNEAEKNRLDGELNVYKEFSKEKIEETEKDLGKLEKEVNAGQEKLDKKLKDQQELEKLKELFERITKQENTEKKLAEQESDYDQREKNVNEFEYCTREFKNTIERVHELRGEIKELSESIQNKKLNQTDWKKKLEENEKLFGETKKAYNEREKLKVKAEDLSKVIEIKKTSGQIEQIEGKIKKGGGLLKEQEQIIEKLKAKEKEKNDELNRLKKDRPDISILTEIKNWFVEKNGIDKSVKAFEKEIEAASNELKKFNKPAIKLIETNVDGIFSDDIHSLSIGELLEKSGKWKGEFEWAMTELDERIAHYTLQSKLDEFTQSLKDGKPCPLCGSREHPEIMSVENVSKQLEEAEKQKGICQQKSKILINIETEINTIVQNMNFQKEKLQASRTKLDVEKKDLEKHKGTFKWEGFSNENEGAINERLENAKKLNETIEQVEKEIKENRDEAEKESAIIEKYKVRLQELNGEKGTNQSKKETLLSQLKSVSLDEFKESAPEDIEREVNSLNIQYEKIEKKYAELEKGIVGLRKEYDTVSGQISEAEMEMKRKSENYGRISGQLETKVESSGYSSVEDIAKILEKKIDIEKEKEDIQQFKQQFHAAREKLKESKAEAKDKVFNKKEYDDFLDEVESLKTLVKNKNKQLVEKSTELKRLQGDIIKKSQLEKSLEKIKEREENINTLKKLFSGKGFVNFISSVFLQNLCNAANERFYKLTKNKYRLELSDQNSINVRDFLNNGQLRLVKTLSGGQKFQASLSLALALAESIQKQAESKQNFFFLDEGFGSQDKESLQIVFETLKTLRKENRFVGIISHVEELQQEIDVFLKIRNDDETGSDILESWEC